MKTNLENIKKELIKRGICAEQVEMVKNGISCIGFQIITDSNVQPVVYYSQGETVNSFMDKIHMAMKEQLPDFDFAVLRDRNFVLSNIYVTVQRRSSEDKVLSRSYLNLEVIMRLHISIGDRQEESGSIKVSASLLEMAGVEIEEAWKAAFANMEAAICVKSMADVLGMPEELFPAPFHVVTTDSGLDGASALLYPEIFREYCKQEKVDACVILPSSTQEVLVVSDEDGACYDDFAAMVSEVNEAEVDPIIQLDPVVYRYDTLSDEIKIVAEG